MPKPRPPRAVENKSAVTSPEVPLADGPVVLPDGNEGTVAVGDYELALNGLEKVHFPAIGATKRDLMQFYLDIAPVLVPHLRDRPMVMKRYPGGVDGDFFFQKRVRSKDPPAFLRTCTIDHGNGNLINFPLVQDTGSLLWVVNKDCIDLNPWYGRFHEVNTPDFLHFDLDPQDAPFERVLASALAVRDALEARDMPVYVKTSGSKGLHIYVPIVWGPKQKAVWAVAKALAVEIADAHPDLMTAAYKKKDRPPGRVLVDYNQNRWGATLASVYSVRPTPTGTVSMPVTWDEVAAGFAIEDFHLGNARGRILAGDAWAPTLPDAPGRFALG